MCVNVSGDELICRFDPAREDEVAERDGFQPMIMKGEQLRGYCYVSEDGYKSKAKANFAYWTKLCLDFNEKAKASKKRRKRPREKRVRSYHFILPDTRMQHYSFLMVLTFTPFRNCLGISTWPQLNDTRR